MLISHKLRATRARIISALAASLLASAGLAVTTTTTVGPAAGPQPAPPAADTTAEGLRLAAGAAPVRLTRSRGTVTGDGDTFVANRTRFRANGTVGLPPRIRARSWIVVDADTGAVLGAHRPHRHLPQASTIKLLTALTAVDTVPERPRHRVTAYEKNQTCSCVGLARGARYTRSALLAGMLLPSGNDAAEALAGSHPEGREAFYAAMNAKAAELGASDTVARNASGLTAEGSHSTARDLVVLLQAALADPVVAPYLSLRSAPFATMAGRRATTVWHATDYVEKYPGSAGKSGFTTPAQNTLVVSTTVAGRHLYVASLGAPSGYSTDGARALARWAAHNRAGLRGLGRVRPLESGG